MTHSSDEELKLFLKTQIREEFLRALDNNPMKNTELTRSTAIEEFDRLFDAEWDEVSNHIVAQGHSV
ncbi:MAG: hypothetical protein EBV30_10405 [Actinobacteria bacterium]|nr:hypothetical protein [Actinomycetota bacterium]